MELLATYREALVARKYAETTIKQRINKYTTHVAFHLYQMYERTQAKSEDGEDKLTDSQMRGEIDRVSQTLIKLMDVVG
jgi:hypothetical protein